MTRLLQIPLALRRIRLPRPVIIGLIVLATQFLGVGLGVLMTTSLAPLAVSFLVILIYLLVISRTPYKGILFWLVLFPFTERWVNISLGEGIPDLSPTRFVALFLGTVLLAQTAAGLRRSPRATALDAWALLFVIGIGASALNSADTVRAFQEIADLTLLPVAMYFIVRNLVAGRADIDNLMTAFLVIGAYSAVLAIHEQLTGTIVLAPKAYTLTEYADGIRILRSLWGSNSIFGSIFAVAIPVAFYRLIKSQTLSRRVAYGIFLGVLMTAMFLTFKRGAWVSMLVSFCVMAPFFPAFRRVFIVLLVVVSVPLAMYWDRLSDSDIVQKRVGDKVDTLNGRTDRWEVAIDLWKQSPIWGHGFRNYDRLSGFQAVENYYLHLLVSGGLVAFVPYIMFLVLTLRESLKLYRRARSPNAVMSRELMAVFWGIFVTYLVKAMTGEQSSPIVNFLFFIVIGAMIGGAQSEDNAAPAPSATAAGLA